MSCVRMYFSKVMSSRVLPGLLRLNCVKLNN